MGERDETLDRLSELIPYAIPTCLWVLGPLISFCGNVNSGLIIVVLGWVVQLLVEIRDGAKNAI